MKSLLLILVLLTGCASKPIIVKSPFPAPPEELMSQPPELITIRKPEILTEEKLKDTTPSNVDLTTVIQITTKNMGICHKYRDQIFGLQDWITNQQQLSK